jgi:hypothetical protein
VFIDSIHKYFTLSHEYYKGGQSLDAACTTRPFSIHIWLILQRALNGSLHVNSIMYAIQPLNLAELQSISFKPSKWPNNFRDGVIRNALIGFGQLYNQESIQISFAWGNIM